MGNERFKKRHKEAARREKQQKKAAISVVAFLGQDRSPEFRASPYAARGQLHVVVGRRFE